MKWKQDNISTLLSAIAIVVSLAAAAVGFMQFRVSERATATANSALEAARRANDIALGNINAEVCVQVSDKDARITPARLPVFLWVRNCGEVQISGVDIHVLPLVGFVYQADDPKNVARPLNHSIHHKIDFPIALSLEGSARINIAPLLAASIARNVADFADPSHLYRGAFNVVVSPIRRGDTVPTAGAGKRKADRDIASIEFTPVNFKDFDVNEITKEIGVPRIVQ